MNFEEHIKLMEQNFKNVFMVLKRIFIKLKNPKKIKFKYWEANIQIFQKENKYI